MRRKGLVSSAWMIVVFSITGQLASQDTVFRYSFRTDEDFPAVFDEGPAGNDATASAGALIAAEAPVENVPDDAGESSLDSGTNSAGIVTDAVSLLTNQAIADAGGFTMETWFLWNGGGDINAILDYAGTEKIVLDSASGDLAMLINGTGRISIADVEPGEWHYVAVVFDTEGAPLTVDGFATGTVRAYLDSLSPRVVREGAIKDDFGDSLVRPIGVGQHPLGFPRDFFNGLVFEPRVTLGPLAPEDLLLDARVVDPPSTLLAYRFSTEMTLPAVSDSSPAGNDATAAEGAQLVAAVPPAMPEGGGDAALDSTAGGAVTDAQALLSSAAIGNSSGFTFETWLSWSGDGAGSVIDSGGTEKLVVTGTGEIQLVVSDSENVTIGQAAPGEWHWVGAVFDSRSRFADGSGTLLGTVTTYFDGLSEPSVTEDVELLATGGGAGIGIGQSPEGGEPFPGLIYAPTVSLGPLGEGALSFVFAPKAPAVVFWYSQFDEDLFPFVPDFGSAENHGVAGTLAAATEDIPEDGVPDDAGEFALDSSGDHTIGATGVVTDNISLLTNDQIAEHGGFTFECWFQWLGAGDVNAIIDYAGTEKLVIDERDPANMGLLEMRMSPTGDLAIATAEPFAWHYVAVVFRTGGTPVQENGSITGTLTAYFDGNEPVAEYEAVTKDTFGDSLARGFGVGQHPLGADLDFFNGYIFEPRVTLGPLSPNELLWNGGGIGPVGNVFVRGDADASGGINLTDGIFILNFLFTGGADPACMDAADTDNSGGINLTDGIYVLNFLFSGGGDPPPPYPDCGTDPELDDDGVTCETAQPSCL